MNCWEPLIKCRHLTNWILSLDWKLADNQKFGLKMYYIIEIWWGILESNSPHCDKIDFVIVKINWLMVNQAIFIVLNGCPIRVCSYTFFDQWHKTIQHDNKKNYCIIQTIIVLEISCCGNFIEAKTTQNDKIVFLCWIFTSKTITNDKFMQIVLLLLSKLSIKQV